MTNIDNGCVASGGERLPIPPVLAAFVDRCLELPLGRRRGLLFVLICAAVLVRYGYALFDPPYWDTAMGPFAEALWLCDNDFNYGRLFGQEPRFVDGGQAVYLWSIYPSLVAIGYTILPSPQWVFFACHLVDLLLGAWIVFIVYATLRDHAMCTRMQSAVGAMCLLSLPVFSAQLVRISMETAVAAAGVTCVYLFLRGRFLALVAVSILGIFIKDAATILSLTLLVFGLLAAGVAPWSAAKKARLVGLLCIPLIIRFSIVGYLDTAAPFYEPFSWSPLLDNIRYSWPLATAIAATTIGVVLLGIVNWLNAGEGSVLERMAHARQSCWQAERMPLLCLLLNAGVFTAWLAAMTTLEIPLPRYINWYLPSLVIAFVAAFSVTNQKTAYFYVAASLVIVLGCLNHRGRLLRELPRIESRSGHQLERSHEYRADLLDKMKVGQFIDTLPASHYVAGPRPYWRMFSQPELGYVSVRRPFARMPRDVGAHIISVAELDRETLMNVIFVRGPDDGQWPTPPNAIMIYHDRARNPISLYRLPPPQPPADDE